MKQSKTVKFSESIENIEEFKKQLGDESQDLE